MKRVLFLSVLFLMITSTAVAQTVAPVTATDKLMGEIQLDMASKYVFRGVELIDNSVGSAGFAASYNDFTLSGKNIYNEIDVSKLFEVDYALNYNATNSIAIDAITLNAGMKYYNFDKLGYDTSELYALIGYNNVVNYNLDIYYDVDQSQGFYLEPGVSYTYLPKSFEKLSLVPSVKVAYDGRGDNAINEFTNAVYSVAANYDFGYDVSGKLELARVAGIQDSFEDYDVASFGLNYKFLFCF